MKKFNKLSGYLNSATRWAQETADRLVEANVRGIELHTNCWRSEDVRVQNVDLTNETKH